MNAGSQEPDVVLDGLDDPVHLAAQHLLGDAEREAPNCRSRDAGRQGERVAVHDHVHHDGPSGVGERRGQGVAHVAGLGDADAMGAERGGYLAEVRVDEISPEPDEADRRSGAEIARSAWSPTRSARPASVRRRCAAVWLGSQVDQVV